MANSTGTLKQKRTYKKKKTDQLPVVFTPRFWSSADHRMTIVRQIQDWYKELKADSQADSVQKDILVRRATFLAVRCETAEVIAAEGGPFDANTYISMTNTLIGLLKGLGLERKIKTQSLRNYIESKDKSA